MTAQAILTTTAIAIITIFTVSFCLDLITTLRQAWKNASPKSQIIPMEETALIKLTAPTPTLPTCATLEWIVSQPDETGEALNVIDLILALFIVYIYKFSNDISWYTISNFDENRETLS